MAVAFGRYELQEKIAEGAIAEAFRAVQRGSGGVEKQVVLKQLRPDVSGIPGFRELFLEETRIVPELTHQNVVQLLELGEHRGRCFVALEPVSGVSLAELLAGPAAGAAGVSGRPLPRALGAYVLARAADGLAFAHERRGSKGEPLRIVHRDLSPENIVVTLDGVVKVTDFGVGRALDRSGRARVNVRHVSPEQIRTPDAVDSRADLFALGVLLHELLTGRPLFAESTVEATLDRILRGEVRPPPGDGLVRELGSIAMLALAVDRDARLQSARDFARRVDAVLARAPSKPGPESLGKHVRQVAGDPALAGARRPPAGRLDSDAPQLPAADSNRVRRGTAQVLLDVARERLDAFVPWARRRIQPWHVAALVAAVVLVGVARWGLARRDEHKVEATLEALNDRTRFREPTADESPPAAPEPAPAAATEQAPAATTVEPELRASPPEPAQKTESTRRAQHTGGAPVIVLPRHGIAGAEPNGWGRLTIDTSPWSDVYFHGAKIGTTPLVEAQLPAGRQTVRVVNPEEGLERVITVQISAGQTTSQKLRLR